MWPLRNYLGARDCMLIVEGSQDVELFKSVEFYSRDNLEIAALSVCRVILGDGLEMAESMGKKLGTDIFLLCWDTELCSLVEL